LGIHISAQDGVDSGLVAALLAEPFQQIAGQRPVIRICN
jgi:hypothetical protein